jgi:gliding motility-associated-like protein
MKNFLFLLFAFLLTVFVAKAQPAFNYDAITICEGDTYDLLNYQTNEVLVPMGWELVGWQDVGSTTVKPTASPTVYTLEYREIANPSVIFTQDLTISLRPKPTVKAALANINTCIENTVEVKKQSAENYDDLYWLWIETGKEYRQDDVTIVTDYTMPTTQTYKLIATNEHCTTIAQAQTTVKMVDIRQSNMSFSFQMGGAGGFDYQSPLKGWKKPYCKPLILEDFVGCKLALPHYNTSGGVLMTDKPGPGESYQQDNGFARVNYIKIVWDNEDAYTAGTPLSGVASYTNTFHIEAEVYWKQCDQTKIYISETYRLELYDNCEGIFYWADFRCDIMNGMNKYVMTHSNLDSIISVDFVNKTFPEQYIPTWQMVSTHGSEWPDYFVQFDENTPANMSYDITVTYRALDESVRTYTFYNIKPPACKAENIAEYAMADRKNGIGFSNLLICDNAAHNQHLCYNVGTTSPPPKSVSRTICDTEKAYFSIRSYNPPPWVIEFDTDDVFPIIIGSGTSATVDGKTVYSCTPAKNPEPFYDSYVDPYMQFEVDGVQKTYTGKINGVAFSFTVNVVDYRLAAQDTTICQGSSIDLKGLEIENNINGSVSWNTGSNTIVAPLVDTEYSVYGVGKYKCASQADYIRTDKVLVKVEPPLWASTIDIADQVGTEISLSNALNTNAQKIEWFDENDNPINENITIEAGSKTYTCKLTNGCGTELRQITVKGLLPPTPCPDGTLLFREDFGGNDPNDPEIMSNADMTAKFGSKIIGYTPNQNPAGPSRYCIRKKGQSNATWIHMDDHSYPNDYTRGYFLQVDGSSDLTGQFYKTQIDNLCVGSTLYFSMWAASVSIGMPLSNLSMIVEDLSGNELARFNAKNIPIAGGNNSYTDWSQVTDPNNCNDWTQYNTLFTITGSTPSVVFKIMNNNSGYSGNDFVIDDIEIRICTPPVEIVAPDKVCIGDHIEITNDFTNDGTFTEPLEYLWLKSPTGDLTSQSSWTTVGTNSNKLEIASATKADEGYYRLAIAGAGGILLENCRAMSDPVFVEVDENCVTPPIDNVKLENDTIYTDCYNLNFKIPLLENAIFTCSSPNLTLLTPPTLNGNSATITNDTMYISIADNIADITRDSVQYEMECNGIKDNAWVQIYINQKSITTSVSETICLGETYSFYGNTLIDSGIYFETLTSNVNACDSIIMLDLTVKNCGQIGHIDNPKPPFQSLLLPCDSIDIPIYFTPNRDGLNDKWMIENIECYMQHIVEIYDRFGKLIRRWEGDFKGWDGLYRGEPMNSTDYWYLIKLYQEDSGRVGHFTLIR